eukprot:9955151-Alexandrium_andersonii.AAC.1
MDGRLPRRACGDAASSLTTQPALAEVEGSDRVRADALSYIEQGTGRPPDPAASGCARGAAVRGRRSTSRDRRGTWRSFAPCSWAVCLGLCLLARGAAFCGPVAPMMPDGSAGAAARRPRRARLARGWPR